MLAADLDFAIQFADNAYSFPAFLSCGTVCKTNVAPFTFMRAPGIAQSLLVTETAVDAVATALGMDGNAVRVLNFLQVVRGGGGDARRTVCVCRVPDHSLSHTRPDLA